jgi:signal recognition particle subunit SRP54
MFDNLSDKLQRAFKNLRGEGKLTPENMESALREIRVALLEAADVPLPFPAGHQNRSR